MTTPRLLLVDDEELFVRGLSRELSGLGWQVATAETAEDALRALRQSEFDAVVLDLQTADSSGAQVLTELDRVLSRPVAILLSGHMNIASTVRAMQNGASDVLEKPVSARDLDKRIRALLAARASSRVVGFALPVELRKILGESSGMRAARDQMQTAARYPDLCVTIVGESGTGKQKVAEAIHSTGSVPASAFLPVNLAATPEQLLEIELFGTEVKGPRDRLRGLFERAGSGTVFFNELSDFPQPLISKLLQALESRSFRRVGGTVDLPLQARIMAGTRRRPPSPEYAELYERLGALTIHLPALRERITDLELIAGHILAELAERTRRPPLTISEAAMEVLVRHSWRGNVRELEIVLSEAAALASTGTLGGDEASAAIAEHGMTLAQDSLGDNASGTYLASGPVSEPLRMLERRMITDAWQTSGRNLSAAARTLGLPRTTLRDRLKKYGLR